MSFPIVLKGTVEKITFINQENGFTVAKFRPERGRGLVTIVGTLGLISPGEILRLEGKWVNDRRYGEQFHVEAWASVVPATVKGIEKYLSSGLIKGIGHVMARRLTSKFGKDTLDVIEREPHRLLEVEGIGNVRLQEIVRAWEDQKAIRDIMVFFHSHGIGPALATKIFKNYKRDAISIVRENPYRLSMEIHGVGFKTADRIANNLGIPRNSRIRAESGIIFILNELTEEGHCYCPEEELVNRCMGVLEIEEDLIKEALWGLEEKGIIVRESHPFDSSPAVYLKALYNAEANTAMRFRRILEAPPLKGEVIDTERAINWVEGLNNIHLAPAQKEAIRKAIEKKVLIITGGPGTGKTTIINSIIKILQKKGLSINLTAPTGRASKRLSEATNQDAKTIHRLLEFSPKENIFRRNEKRPLDCDLVIVDEASMLDIFLLNNLLRAIPNHAGLILVGDRDQLPSVGPGNCLGDLIESGIVPVVKLNEIFRQARESRIIVNAHRVREGHIPEIYNEAGSDFFIIKRESPESTLDTVLDLCTKRLPRAFGLDPIEDIQVISPMHKGVVGVGNLNKELQTILNPRGKEVNRWDVRYRVRDKVMQIRNNYEKEVFNGDIGRIMRIDFENQRLTVRFDDRDVDYEFSELDEIVPAYAISVHKAQGSEYPAVIIPILTQHYVLLQRNLLYTAITRGRKLVVIVGNMKAIAIAVKNDRIAKRYTYLKERLKGL